MFSSCLIKYIKYIHIRPWLLGCKTILTFWPISGFSWESRPRQYRSCVCPPPGVANSSRRQWPHGRRSISLIPLRLTTNKGPKSDPILNSLVSGEIYTMQLMGIGFVGSCLPFKMVWKQRNCETSRSSRLALYAAASSLGPSNLVESIPDTLRSK